MKTLTTLLVAFFLQLPLVAQAAYCGSPADTSQIQSLVMQLGPADSSRIMDIVVAQQYARADVQSKGRLTEYFVKDCGHWRFAGYSLPSDAPAAVASQLGNFVTRDKGGTECLNPSYVNHPSGA